MANRPAKPENRPETPTPPNEKAEEAVDLGLFGHQLRRLYHTTVQEPVPQDMLDLLDELEKKTGSNGDDKKS